MELLPAIRKSIIAFVLLPTLLYAGIPPTLQSDASQRMTKDIMNRAYITPKRIVTKYAGCKNNLIKDEHYLLERGNGQSEMNRKKCCIMTSTETEKASLLLDFGSELHGGLKLVMGSSSRREPSLVRIRFGESVGEANSSTSNSEWKVGFSTADHAKRDIIMEIPRDGMIEIGNTGFRFVRLDLLQNNATISLKEISAILRYRDIPYLGSFECNDQRLNKIWITGAYTVHLNMQEFLWDGIKRDRVVWLADMHPELMTISRVFGYNEVIPNSLDLACKQFPLPNWMNGMSAYSLWYLINQYEWYHQTGDIDFLKKHSDYISGLIHLINGKVDDAGNETLAPARFLDWPSSGNKAGVEAGYRALIVWAMQDAHQLSLKLGNTSDAQLCLDIINRMKKKILPHNNLKQAAKTMNFLTEHKIEQYADLVSRIEEMAAESGQAADALKNAEKRLAEMAVLIKNVSTYQKTKPVYDAYRKARNREKYRAGQEQAIILHEAAVRSLKAAGIAKLPNLAALQSEYEALQAQKEALYADYGKLKKKVREYDIIKQNIDSILQADRQPEREKETERG